MIARYDPVLVLMSAAIAVLASYVALDLTGRVYRSVGRARAFWWAAGAAAMGIGIWSMHFVAMLALRMPWTLRYDVGLLVLSVVVAIAASGLALHVASRDALTIALVTASSALMGAAISGMHYIGMAAMIAPVVIHWQPVLVVASIAIAVAASFAALTAGARLRKTGARQFVAARLGAAVVMAVAICGMHYTGMAAARYVPSDAAVSSGRLTVQAQGLSLAVVAGTLLILGLALAGNQIAELTERREAERALRDSERRYRYIFQAAGVSILELGLSPIKAAIDQALAERGRDLGRYVDEHPELVEQTIARIRVNDSNDAALALFAASSTSHLAASLPQIFLPETARAFAHGLLAIAAGQTRFTAETMLRTLAGATRTVLFTITLPPPPAPLETVLVSLTDITDRKRAEEALRLAETELAHVTRVMTLGEMAASLAHEVSQPLGGAVINAKTCLRWLAADPVRIDEAREATQRIVRDANRAAEVVARIRALSKKGETEKIPLDMTDVVRDVIALAEGELRKNNVQLNTRLASGLPRVLGDRVQLQQVLLNLVMNGVEAMRDIDRPRTLLVATEPIEPDSVRIAVRDSGPGIDPRLANRIFDAFYTTKPAGLGMGLSISRSIVSNHGGVLKAVDNADGPGATLEIVLQSAPPAEPAGHAGPEPRMLV